MDSDSTLPSLLPSHTTNRGSRHSSGELSFTWCLRLPLPSQSSVHSLFFSGTGLFIPAPCTRFHRVVLFQVVGLCVFIWRCDIRSEV